MSPSSAETLNDLALRHGTDKASGRHDFAETYDEFLAPLRDEPIKLLEIGVKAGASVRMWRDYFARGQIYGIDIKRAALDHAEERIHVFVGDQKDEAVLTEITNASGPLDVIIDDG